ncbi:MAG: PepSY-associated TM helix domain-containing protein [Pseudomonadota bacterium]
MNTAASIAPARRPGWLKTLHQWHWISSAICLLGMVLFAVTGITLNHAADIGSKPTVLRQQLQLPEALQAQLAPAAAEARQAPLPPALAAWAAAALGIEAADQEAEWSPEEIYLTLPRPGGDAWLRIDRESGEAEYEVTDRGWISYLNDLHKGRHTGGAWRWFIDIFSAACLVFSLSGLLILKYHAGNRPGTWPLVGLGALVPLLLALLLMH